MLVTIADKPAFLAKATAAIAAIEAERAAINRKIEADWEAFVAAEKAKKPKWFGGGDMPPDKPPKMDNHEWLYHKVELWPDMPNGMSDGYPTNRHSHVRSMISRIVDALNDPSVGTVILNDGEYHALLLWSAA